MITAADRTSLQALRPLGLQALRAPSIHNTQPWHFVAGPGSFSIRADRARQLPVLDPSGRQLTISCGCALFNARVAGAAAGMDVTVTRLPDPTDRDLLASLDVAAGPHENTDDEDVIAELNQMIRSRRTNRRQFDAEPVPAAVIAVLAAAAEIEGARLVPVLDDRDRSLVAELSTSADRAQQLDPSYRAELRAWTSDDPLRLDGVPAIAVPHVDSGSGDEIPIRDFDTRGTGYLPTQTRSTRDQCLVLLGSDADDELSWLRAGEALQRVLLTITALGFAASPLTQAIELPASRAELRAGLRLTMHPHLLLRIGRAAPTAGTPRRHAYIGI
jgi:hypothetical protein